MFALQWSRLVLSSVTKSSAVKESLSPPVFTAGAGGPRGGGGAGGPGAGPEGRGSEAEDRGAGDRGVGGGGRPAVGAAWAVQPRGACGQRAVSP